MSKPIKLTKAQRRQVEAIAEVLKPWGLAWDVEQGGVHLLVKVRGPTGGVWKLTVACTPRDEDAAVGVCTQKAKRLVRDINARAGY